MKTKLLILSLLLTSSLVLAQPSATEVDTFDENVENWNVGGAPPSFIPNGGPLGAGDGFIEYISSGAQNGGGSKIIVINQTQWTGNYATSGILGIRMDVKVEGGRDLNIRFALANATGQANGPEDIAIATSVPQLVTSGSGWNTIIIPIDDLDFEVVRGSGAVASVLANAVEARILHNDVASWIGASTGVVSTMQIDNITALTTLNVQEFDSQDEFSISPNPATSRLNVYLPKNSSNASIVVYDVLGKRVFKNQIDKLSTSIDVSKWNSGVYLVRISSDNTTQTKRFVKH